MRDFKVGDKILCIKDCIDNHGSLMHSVGEYNKIVEYKGGGAEVIIIIPPQHLSKLGSKHHVVGQEYLKEYFISKEEYRKMKIDVLLDGQ